MGKAVGALRDRMATISDLRAASALLSWDQLTMMPIDGGTERGQQIKTVEMIAHQMLIDAETERLLEASEREAANNSLDEIDASLVRVTRHDFDRAARVPGDLVGEIAKAAADGYAIWTDARANADFGAFLPALEKNIELRFRYIECFDATESPYDVLVEDFEEGLTSAEISRVFEGLKPALRPLIDRVVERADAVDDSLLHQHFPVAGQQKLGKWALGVLGFDEGSWRLDPTVHPFQSSIGIADIRLTTRYNEHDVSDSLLSTIHEFGHGIYEAQIDPALARSPMGTGCSMTLHESQSRFWENVVGRSREFADLLHPQMASIFPEQMQGTTPDSLFRALNRMKPSLIRVEADELTYGFHIIMRYELERAIIEGRMKAAELPEAWNSLTRQYLGIDVPDDRVGVLQDVHWSAGSIGYFPTYFLGSILAAQIWKRMIADLPDARELIKAGEFAAIREWQRTRLHRFGRMYTPRETIENVAGQPLDPSPYVSYMTSKVNALYGPAA